MNTSSLVSASTSPNLLDLFRGFIATYKNWRNDRFLASIDFRELSEDEITDEIRQDIERVKKIPRENLINI
jgi:hypothetical protein